MPECVLTDTATRYERDHQVAIYERGTLPMITPGGMVLEQPRMVLATDTLSIVQQGESALCVELVTVGRNRHECRIAGIAQNNGRERYFLADSVAIERLTDGEILVEPIGASYGRFCQEQGRIERATYSQR